MVHKKEMTFKWKGAPTDGVAESNGRSYRFSPAIYSDSGRTDHLTSVRIWSGLAAVVTMDSAFFLTATVANFRNFFFPRRKRKSTDGCDSRTRTAFRTQKNGCRQRTRNRDECTLTAAAK